MSLVELVKGRMKRTNPKPTTEANRNREKQRQLKQTEIEKNRDN